MKVFTVKVPARLSARVSRLAKERNVTQSELIRRALEDYTEGTGETFVDRFAHLIGAAKRGPHDLSTNRRHLRGYGR